MRHIKHLLFALATVLTISSCVSDVDDVFDKPSSQRITEAIAADKAILVNQPNGWVLKIYGDLDFGGYNLLLKFNDDNSLKTVGEIYYNSTNPASYEVETSHYKLEQSSGVVLSFDEYCKNIHFFSDPANPAGLGTNSKGFYADLEFRILSASPDSIVMQGKKHGNRLVMVPSPVTEENWQSYLDKVSDVESDMDCANYKINVADKSYTAKITYRSITVTIPTEDGNEYMDIPYTVTPDGFSFYKDVALNGKTLKGFKYVENAMIYPELNNSDVNLEAVVPPLNQQFVGATWYPTLSSIGTFGKPYWNAIKEQIMGPVLGETLVLFSFGKVYSSVMSTYGDYFGITFASNDGSSNYFGGMPFNYELTGDDQITMSYNGGGANVGNGTWYINNGYFHYLMVPFGCDTQAKPVERTFKLTTDNLKKPSMIMLTDVDNDKNVIQMSASPITTPFEH